MTSSSPTVAMISDSQSAGEERVFVESCGQLEHEVREDRAGTATSDLRGDVEAGVAGRDAAESAIDERHGRVEVRSGDRAEDEDEADQRRGSGSRVLEQLQTRVMRRQAAGHDPGSDHRDDEESRPDSLRCQTTREVELDA